MAPKTPDRSPGVSDEEGVDFETTGLASAGGQLRYTGTRFSMFDNVGEFDPRLGGSDERVKVTGADTGTDYLDNTIVVSGDLTKQVLNPGADEQLQLAVNVSNVFSVDQIQQTGLLSTSSTSPQDAFSGSSVTVAEDGDYLAFFEGDTRVTNNNGRMSISVEVNSVTTEQGGSIRVFEGNDRGSTITIFRLNNLNATDTVHGLFRKFAGAGTAQIRRRSLTIMRIA